MLNIFTYFKIKFKFYKTIFRTWPVTLNLFWDCWKKSNRLLQTILGLKTPIFDLILQIVIRVYSDHLLTRCSKLGNVFNELLAKSLYLLPLSKWGKVVSATGFEPVTHWLKVNCSTNWATRPKTKMKLFDNSIIIKF